MVFSVYWSKGLKVPAGDAGLPCYRRASRHTAPAQQPQGLVARHPGCRTRSDASVEIFKQCPWPSFRNQVSQVGRLMPGFVDWCLCYF